MKAVVLRVGLAALAAGGLVCASGGAAEGQSLGDPDAIPYVGDSAKEEFKSRYAKAGLNKAFVISPKGNWAWRSSRVVLEWAVEAALEACESRAGSRCYVYALNNRVVWDPKEVLEGGAKREFVPYRVEDKVHPDEELGPVRVKTARYGRLPVTIYFPQGQGPFPLVVYNHGRAPTNISVAPYCGGRQVVQAFFRGGYAVAFPVRSGYHLAGGEDGEKVNCSKSLVGFEDSGKSMARDVGAAITYLKTLPEIDKGRIYVGGISAGGAAAIFAMADLDGQVRAYFSINGGRCGYMNRPGDIGGLTELASIYRRIGSGTHAPIAFFGGTRDTVVPESSSRELHGSFCRGRGDKCQRSVSLVVAEGGTHVESSMFPRIGDAMLNFLKAH